MNKNIILKASGSMSSGKSRLLHLIEDMLVNLDFKVNFIDEEEHILEIINPILRLNLKKD